MTWSFFCTSELPEGKKETWLCLFKLELVTTQEQTHTGPPDTQHLQKLTDFSTV